jgi:hypothetical protein
MVPEAKAPVRPIGPPLRIAAIVLRTLFICIVAIVTVRVSRPQNETLWSAYETPGDIIRLLLGFVVCVWIVAQLFRLPKDEQGYRTWLYLGIVLVPLSLIFAIAIW